MALNGFLSDIKRRCPKSSTILFLLSTMILLCNGVEISNSKQPLEFLPKCPAKSNYTVGQARMQRFHVIFHRLGADGRVYRKPVNILKAHEYAAKSPHFDLRKKTVIYVAGWVESSVFPENYALANILIKRGYNVMFIETLAIASRNYFKMTRLTYPFGDKISDFLVKLYRLGLKPDLIEITGLSIGAQMGSITAKYFYKKTGEKVGKLIGLDPAGPCFKSYPVDQKFDVSDAKNVLAVHTNINGFGSGSRIAHVDFYMNGGEYQMSDVTAVPCMILCSHIKAQIYWWIAIEHPKQYIGVKCNSVEDATAGNCFDNTEFNYLGLETDFNKPGIYYVAVTNKFPYFMGKHGLSPKKVAEAKKLDNRKTFIPFINRVMSLVNSDWLNDDMTLKNQ